jgi:hypothetical protein
MKWEQTVGLVRSCRFGLGIADFVVRWCRAGPVVSGWSGGVGLVCGMKCGILEADVCPLRGFMSVNPGTSTIPDWRIKLWTHC